MTKKGKRISKANEGINRSAFYSLEEAIQLIKDRASAKFDETVELHVRTGLDPRHAEQQLRGTALLPHGLGKPVRVLVFAEGEAARNAEEAGAGEVGGEDLVKKVEGGYVEFDVALAERGMMGQVGKLGRVLGPRGLMPNPRTGTVVDAAGMTRAVEEAMQGKVEFRLDKTSLMHAPIGKVSFDDDKLLENLSTLVHEMVKAKPESTKGVFVHNMTLTTTMGPSIKLDLTPTLALKAN